MENDTNGASLLPENFLDRAVPVIEPELAHLSLQQLGEAKLAEITGKTRKTLMASIAVAQANAMPVYRGTKDLRAGPMTRGDYNAYRGWTIPADESPEDAGYLVEYVDGGKPNDGRHEGYISWSPADVFEQHYHAIDPDDPIGTMPFHELQGRYRDILLQLQGLSGTILDLDIRGTEDMGAIGVAELRLREAYGAGALAATATVSDPEGAAAYEAAKLGQVASFADMPQNGNFVLRFAAGAEFIDGAREVDRTDLSVSGGRATYAQLIDFPIEGAAAKLTEAWLIASSGEAVCCELGNVGLIAGGGHHAQIPSGHLLF